MKHLAVKKKVWGVVLTAVLLAGISGQTVAAAPVQEEKVSLTINAHTGGKGISGVEWSIYQVAEMTYNGVFTLTDAFASSGLNVESLDGISADEMQKSAANLVLFVSENQIKADWSEETDKDGNIVLKNMERGLYLIRQSGNRNTDLIVKSQPFFVSLPMMKNTNGALSWQYDVAAAPKLEVTVPEPSEPETTVPEPSEPETSVPEPNEPETSVPKPSEPDTNVPETSVPNPEPPNNRPSPDGSNHPDGSSTITITDGRVPLASFDPTPDDMDLIVIEDEPIPLGGFPVVPKMGDMGSGTSAAGIIISSIVALGALIRRRKYTGEED